VAKSAFEFPPRTDLSPPPPPQAETKADSKKKVNRVLVSRLGGIKNRNINKPLVKIKAFVRFLDLQLGYCGLGTF
jgi:hypothetical protein